MIMRSRPLTILVFAALLAGCQSDPTIQTGPDAEVSAEGLYRVDNSKVKMVWVKPGLNLSGYTKIKLVGDGIEYRAVRPARGTKRANSSRSAFPLDAKQRARLESMVGEAFRDEISRSKHYTIVEDEGPEVLEVRGALFGVVSNVPPDIRDRGDIYLTRIGEAGLIIELRDSESNEILARSIERRWVDPVVAVRSNPATNMSEARREIRRWATLLRERLDSFHDEHVQ